MITCRCSTCFRKLEDGKTLEVLTDGKTLCPYCGREWVAVYSSTPDREASLRFFREFPGGRHEWTMNLQEKQNFIDGISLLEMRIGSHDGELFSAAASAIGYGIPGGIFEQLIAVLNRDHDFLRLGISELGWIDSPKEYLRYAAMLCLKKHEFIKDLSSRIRAVAINHLCDAENLPIKNSADENNQCAAENLPVKAPAMQELCMKAAEKLDDEFASLQMDYLFEEVGGSLWVTPSSRYPESKAFGPLGRFCCLLGGLCVCLPLAGFVGYWIGKYAQWRIKSFVIPNAEWWIAGALMIASLFGLVFAYPQWVQEEKSQKAKGRMKRDWPVSKNLKKALKRRSKDEVKAAILLGGVDGLEAFIFPVTGNELTYVSPAGQTTVITDMGNMIHELSEALRHAADFMIPCQRIVYPSSQTVTINIRYPNIGFLVMEERMAAMSDENTLVGEVFAIALPCLIAEIKQRLVSCDGEETQS